jgi:flagellar hook-associated protein 3 FlgL
MTRVTDSITQRSLIQNIFQNKDRVFDYSNQLSTGLKVTLPGQSEQSGTISRYQQTLGRIEAYTSTISQSRAMLQFQDDVMNQLNDLILRAKEVGVEGANESVSPTARAQLAAEVIQIRDHVVGLANTQFQGRYIYGGADDDDPPYDPTTYTNPATGPFSQRYIYDAENGTSQSRSVNITDELTLTVNTPGNQVFDTAIRAIERLSRSLQGYTTTLTGGAPDGGGVAYSFPDDFHNQTSDIQAAIDQLDIAREQQVIPERVTLGGKLRRIETAESLLSLTKNTAEDAINRLQGADETEAAAGLTQAQTALEASYTVTAKAIRMTILDYI